MAHVVYPLQGTERAGTSATPQKLESDHREYMGKTKKVLSITQQIICW